MIAGLRLMFVFGFDTLDCCWLLGNVVLGYLPGVVAVSCGGGVVILQIWLVCLLFCYGFAFWGLLAIWCLVVRYHRLFRFSWFTLNLDAVILFI